MSRRTPSGLHVAEAQPVILDLAPGKLHLKGLMDHVAPWADELAGQLGLPPIAGGASFSDYLENKVLDHVLGKSAFTMPTTVAMALCTAAPTDASTGATIVEATYTNYSRKVVAAGDLNAAASGQTTNANPIVFNACTGSSSAIIAWALLDSSTTGAGNVLAWGTCASTTISITQTPPTVAAGGLVVNLD